MTAKFYCFPTGANRVQLRKMFNEMNLCWNVQEFNLETKQYTYTIFAATETEIALLANIFKLITAEEVVTRIIDSTTFR